MNFNPEKRLAITKSIIELTDQVESCGLVEGRSKCRSRNDIDAAMFYDDNQRDLPTIYNRPLYNASANGVELKKLLLDPSSSINIISLSTLDAVGVS